MLKIMQSTVYNKTPKTKEFIWNKVEFALFARLKNHTIVFLKARKEKTAMPSNVKSVEEKKIVSITKKILKNVLQSMKDGLIEILKKFSKTKELIITVIRKGFWRNCVNLAKKMDIEIQRPIVKEIGTKSTVTISWLWPLNWVKLKSLIFVKDVKTIVSPMPIIMIIQSLLMSFGFVENVMAKSIGFLYQRERLNLRTPKGDAIVQTTEETCRGELEAVPPPRNWSVGLLWPKVIEWLRHTAGCSFYQGQCITNDTWLINLRSTGI